MQQDPQTINSLTDLRTYIYETLCSQNELEAGAFPITERILVRKGEPCGLHFCLHGPRNVKITAIWDMQASVVLFYNCIGERICRARLEGAAELAAVA